MVNLEKLTSHLSGEHKQVVQNILDKIFRASLNQQPIWTDFFDPGVITLSEPILRQVPEMKIIKTGGFPSAERCRFIAVPDWYQEEHIDHEIGFLKISQSKHGANLNHRDYLGAILGLGIKREKIGDLIISEHSCQVVLVSDLLDYVRFNLKKVGNSSINIEIADKVEQLEAESQEIISSVASMRLDVILAAGFNISREKAAQLIKGEKVKLNYLACPNVATVVKAGDLISCRGKGRIQILDLLGETKKGRTRVKYLKFS